MTRLFDENKTVEITMRDWDNNTNTATLDWGNDFFEVGGLEFDEEREAYKVNDVDYCIEQAADWMNCEGDFRDDYVAEGIERQVFVDEV